MARKQKTKSESNTSKSGASKSKESGKASRPKKATLAERADKFECYQKSVQSPDHEVEFFEQAYQEAYHRKPYLLREDFCGTYAVCCEWAKSNRRRKAYGVDLCAETLAWGTEHNLSQLTPATQRRVTVVEEDVRSSGEPVDVLAAQNFSFWIFKTREEVIEYFKHALANLKEQGVMVMDMMGGGECFTENHVDKRTIVKGKKGFKYYWKQARYNPVTGDASFSISFKFKDGSKLKNAFEYHWRFWSIPEVREMLAEAGFSESHVYWEEEDEDGEDTGVWSRQTEVPSNPSWICYIVAVK